jgi:hypothetical protein
VRAMFHAYNTDEDVDVLLEGLMVNHDLLA